MCIRDSFFGGRIGAQAGEADLRSTVLVEGAKKEGKVVLYTSVETEFARALTSAFEAKYPTIQTDIFRSTHEKIFSRMNVERQTGTYTADVISVGEFETFHLQRRGFIAAYKSCLLYTSDAADERSSVDLGGRRI